MLEQTVIAPGDAIPLVSLIDRARLAARSGEWDEALAGYRAAILRIHAGEMPEQGPRVLRLIGRVYMDQGNYDDSHSAYEASLVNAQALGLTEACADALNGLAGVEQFRGRLDVAEALYTRAVTLSEEMGNTQLCAMIDVNLGTLANTRGDMSSALMRYQSALERFRELGDDRSCSMVLNNMGMLHVDVGENSAAELCYNAAYELAGRMGDVVSQAKIEGNKAELYLKRQNYERARECCERAFKAFSQIGSDVGLGEVHKFYGVFYRETGKPQVAHVQLGLALKLAKSCENPLLEAECESERARLFLDQKQAAQALHSLNRAHRIFSELDARREILDLRRRLDRMESTYMQAVELLSDDLPHPQPAESNRRGKRVAEYAGMLADAVGYADVARLRIGAYLRDVGNRKLPQDVLEKAGPLTVEEWELVRKHTLMGDDLIQQLAFPDEIRMMVRSHHEHWDGSGYPDRLVGEEIPLAARIVCIADVYDALISPRSFRGAFTSEQALEIMEIESGHIFDPVLIQKFAGLIRMGGPAALAPVVKILRAAV